MVSFVLLANAQDRSAIGYTSNIHFLNNDPLETEFNIVERS